MLSPIVIPVPLALAFVALLAAALWAANRFLDLDLPNPWAGQSWAWSADKPTGGRHRPENLATPVTLDDVKLADRLTLHPVLDDVHTALAVQHGWDLPGPLAIAGLPDREPVEPGDLHVTGDLAVIATEQTSELATV